VVRELQAVFVRARSVDKAEIGNSSQFTSSQVRSQQNHGNDEKLLQREKEKKPMTSVPHNGEEEDFDAFMDRVLEEAGIDLDLADETGERTRKAADRGNDEGNDDGGDFLEWLVSETQAKSPPVSKAMKELRSKVSSSNAGPASPLEHEEESDIALRLAKELKSHEVESTGNLIHILKEIGHIPHELRAEIFRKLLHVSEDVHIIQRFASSQNSDVTKEDEENILRSMASAALRRQGLEDQDELLVELQSSIRVIVRSFGIDASFCDPGVADVALVLISPQLKVCPYDLGPFIQALQRKRVVALQFPHDHVVSIILQKRAKLLHLGLELHGEELCSCVDKIGPLQQLVPWRWWRCAFAGEISLASILPIWDLLVTDACPESYGDHGPSNVSQHTGVWEGCDPRGPLAVYLILALLLSRREIIMKTGPIQNKEIMTSQMFREVLHSATRDIPESEAHELCAEARALRASTPLDLVEEAFDQESYQVPIQEPPSEKILNEPKTSMNFRERFKLTFGFGDSSAEALTKEKFLRDRQFLKQLRLLKYHLQFLHGSEAERFISSLRIAKYDQDEVDCVDVSNSPCPPSPAQAKFEISGLARGTIFSFTLFRPLQQEEWHILALNDQQFALIVQFRVIVGKFIKGSEEIDLLRDQNNVGALERATCQVHSTFHVSEISHVSIHEDVFVKLHHDEDGKRFQFAHEQSKEFFVREIQRMAAEIFL